MAPIEPRPGVDVKMTGWQRANALIENLEMIVAKSRREGGAGWHASPLDAEFLEQAFTASHCLRSLLARQPRGPMARFFDWLMAKDLT